LEAWEIDERREIDWSSSNLRPALHNGMSRRQIARAGTEDGMAEVTITAKRNGPYIVSGPVTLKDAQGNLYPEKATIALCRCGASTTKPFCDGTHSKVGFQAAEQAVPSSAE